MESASFGMLTESVEVPPECAREMQAATSHIMGSVLSDYGLPISQGDWKHCNPLGSKCQATLASYLLLSGLAEKFLGKAWLMGCHVHPAY